MSKHGKRGSKKKGKGKKKKKYGVQDINTRKSPQLYTGYDSYGVNECNDY